MTGQGFENLPSYSIVAVTVLAYFAVGLQLWAGLVSQADTPDELAFVAGTAVSPLMGLGKGFMILTWPIWIVIPAIIIGLMDAISGRDR